MIALSLKEILTITKGKIIKEAPVNGHYTGTSINSMNIKDDNIFFSFKSKKYNTSEFVKTASKNGASLCIIENKSIDLSCIPSHTSIILVNNTLEAIQNLAKYYRDKLKTKVIGITGSTGKTTTKDMISSVLSTKYKVYKTQENYNNHIGLPLSILNIQEEDDIAVLEMGVSMINEMDKLCDIAKPDIAVITNIGQSHLEFFKTRENILLEKIKITKYFDKKYNTLIVNGDDDLLNTINNDKYNIIKIGIHNDKCEFMAKNIALSENSIKFNIEDEYNIKTYIEVDAVGEHNIYNSLIAISCGRLMDLYYDEIKDGLKNIEKTSMRLEIIKKYFTIINDCYNASPDSMKSSIDYLKSFKKVRKIAVLGDMKELGTDSYNFHKFVGTILKQNNIDYLFVMGEFSDAYKEGFGEKNIQIFNDKSKLISNLINFVDKNDIILVKASRSMHFEEITESLKNINDK